MIHLKRFSLFFDLRRKLIVFSIFHRNINYFFLLLSLFSFRFILPSPLLLSLSFFKNNSNILVQDSFRVMPGLDDLELFSFWVASRLPLTAQVSVGLLQVSSTLQRLQSLLQVIQGGNPLSANCNIQ
jgi:hypothetical protein